MSLNKAEWQEKLKSFQEMLKKANENKVEIENQIEELEVFLLTIKSKIDSFK